MSIDDRVRQAAHNNAALCDSVCRAHGLPGEFAPHIWINRHRVPQFYPNAVTISDGADSATQIRIIESLIASTAPGPLSIKDSFSALDLAPLGFEVMFISEWIYRAASIPPPHSRIANLRWSKIDNASELGRWENAWRGDSHDSSSTPPPRIFAPPLLDDPDIAILAIYRDAKIVAGVIANRSADTTSNRNSDVVGISNLFAPPVSAPVAADP